MSRKHTDIRRFLLESTYNNLCVDCRDEVTKMIEHAANHPIPDNPGDLVENVHYYKQGHLMVMTESYLLSRGYCCNSGCRHCPYGHSE